MKKPSYAKIVFGLKVRQLRQERGWNFQELSRISGISVSYLNEIEKGKKYPQPENLDKLAAVFEVKPAFLTSMELTKQYAPLGDLLQSNFLNELPLDLFGIELQQIVEIIARAPERVNAFISAILEIARNYSLRDENFFFAALRAYQEMRMNYFEEIEAAADAFVKTHNLPVSGGVHCAQLADLLKNRYGYKIDFDGLSAHPELNGLRSVFMPKKKKLLLDGRLSDKQVTFQLAKELGFNVLQHKERPYTSSLLRIHSFEEVLNNFLAAYFGVAIIVNRTAFVADLGRFFSEKTWNPGLLAHLLEKYKASPEVLFQRFNVLSKEFNLHKVFFLRFIHDLPNNSFEIDKELHLNRRHVPHATGLHEHYCRRWLSIDLLNQLQASTEKSVLSGVQIAHFHDTDEAYLCISVAKPGFPTLGRNVSITLGVLLDDHSHKLIAFSSDPNIPKQTVNVTCQRCPIADCAERAAPANVLEKREDRRKMVEKVKELTGM